MTAFMLAVLWAASVKIATENGYIAEPLPLDPFWAVLVGAILAGIDITLGLARAFGSTEEPS